MERQMVWGSRVVADVFAGGVGGGLFFISFLIERIYSPTALTYVGTLLGPLLVLVGIILLFTEVGKPANAIRAFMNFRTSWMARGVILQPIAIAAGLIYVLSPSVFPGLETDLIRVIIGYLAAVLALLIAMYHGLLFSQAKGIALWSNPLLPLLFFVSALAGGTGVLLLLSPFFYTTTIHLMMAAYAEMVFVCLSLISTWLMFFVVHPNAAYQASLKKLITPSFIILVPVMGNVLPLILLSSLLLQGITISTVLLALTGIMVLVGTYYLRHAITHSAYYYPIRIRF